MPFLWFRRKKKKSKKNQSAEERIPVNIQNGVTHEEESYINTLIDPTQDSSPRTKPYSESVVSTSTNVDMFRLGLEVAKPFAPWIESVTKIIEEITSIFENAQYNQKTCLVLVERVEAIAPSVKKLFRHKEENEHKFRNQEYFNAFIRFHKILQQIKEFVNDVSQLKGYRKYTHANDVKGRCQFLIREFEKCCRDLQFNILISDDDRVKEEEYLENDVIAMKKFLEASGQLENQDRIKLDLVFDEISEMHKKMKKIMNNNEDELLNAPQIPGGELSDPETKVSRNKVYKQMLRQVVPVACKPVIIPDNSSKEALRIKGQLAILGRLYSSNHIIKFHGVSTIGGHKIIVLDWADHGSLRKVYEENSQVLTWHVKLRIAHEICNGLVFLQACGIFHHDIRCENILITGGDRYEAKIANFYLSRDTSQMSHGIPNLATIVRWLAPEKMPRGNNPIKEPYTFKCEIFSFGMLLWELAFERFPYKNMEMPDITEHVLAKKRETLNFPADAPPEIITGFNNIIVASWNHDPHLRPVIKDLFNDFTMLVNNHSRNSSGIEFITQTASPPKSSPEIVVTVVEENIENIDDLYLTALPPSLKPIIPLEEGINAHRNSEREKAWECFEIHAHLGDPKAKYWMGYYLWEGYHKPKDQDQAKKLFKEAADAGVADAQLRYAFAISKENVKEFIKYLIKAADNANATAQYNMADMYLKGRLGVDKDEKKGLQYLRLAALKSQPKAIEALKHYDVNAIYV